MDTQHFLHTVAITLDCDAKRAEALTFTVFQELGQAVKKLGLSASRCASIQGATR